MADSELTYRLLQDDNAGTMADDDGDNEEDSHGRGDLDEPQQYRDDSVANVELLHSTHPWWHPGEWPQTAGGLLGYATIIAMVLAATQGGMGRLLADQTPANFVYVFLTQLTLLVWLIAAVTRKWETSNIPYSDVLEPVAKNVKRRSSAGIGKKEMLGSAGVAGIAAGVTLVLFFSLAAYFGLCWKEAHDMDHDCYSGSPVVVEFLGVVLVFVAFCTPWPLPLWPARKRLVWRVIQSFGNIFCWPVCGGVKFIHIVVTDTMTSTCLLLWQFEFSLCLFLTTSWIHGSGQDSGQGASCVDKSSINREYIRPLVIALPFYLRLCQSLYIATFEGKKKQYINALKYLSALAVVFTSAQTYWDKSEYGVWRVLWILSLVIKTVFCYSWDVLVDWGLFQDGILRPKVFFSRRLYISALIFNFFGRIAWALAISPAFCHADCTLGLGLLEMFRRAMWLLIRVELAYTLQLESS